jgi:16S rRNA (guanine(966)-N(2))-methyltransferase RsmD
MRIIAGKYKNRLLKYPKNIRPASQIQKKSIFDIIRPFLTGKTFLDLCAGSGQMGIEALSQGADKAFFVEKVQSNISVIKSNLHILKVNPKEYQINKYSVADFIKSSDMTFDIIFADPPYFDINWSEFQHISNIMHPNTVFILKFSPHHPPDPITDLSIIKTKTFKDTHINFYQRIPKLNVEQNLPNT